MYGILKYVIASYRDFGLNVNRENHEYESGKILLNDKELKRLNLLVSQFLDFAELQALEQRTMKMQDWVEELDSQILLNRRKILEGNGKISHEEAIKKAEKEFQIYREREMKELQSDFDMLMKSLPNKKGD